MGKQQSQSHADRRTVIIAHHLILTGYGHWAPNDPRGSGSEGIRNERFDALGPVHEGRKPREEQPSRGELREFHRGFGRLLEQTVLWFDDALRSAAAAGFAEAIRRRGYTCYACAICGNHAHLVVRVHRDDAMTIWRELADASREHVRAARLLGEAHQVWASRPYKVFLHTPEDVRRCVRYVEENPVKEGREAQRWEFVSEYDGWPLHHKGK